MYLSKHSVTDLKMKLCNSLEVDVYVLVCDLPPLEKRLSIFKQAYVAIHSFGNLVIHPSSSSHVVGYLRHSRLIFEMFFFPIFRCSQRWLFHVKDDMIS